MRLSNHEGWQYKYILIRKKIFFKNDMPTLSSMVALQVVIMTICKATSAAKFGGIMKTSLFQCSMTWMNKLIQPAPGAFQPSSGPLCHIYRDIVMNCIDESMMNLVLTHWGWVTHICVGKQTIIGSDNGLSPGWRQAIIWTNAGILLIGPLGTNFSEISIKIQIFSFTKMCLKVSSAKWCPFWLGLNVLSWW